MIWLYKINTKSEKKELLIFNPNNMKLLVTGGAGFIGSNFILYWLKNYPNDYIINLDLLTYAGNPDNLKEIENHPGYQFVRGDICDTELVERLADEGLDAIVHFAAESHVDRSILDASVFVRTNVIGTHVLLEAARKRNLRFHHVSTDEVYGSLSLEGGEKFSEQTAYDPRSPYSASKASSDHLVRAYFHTHKLPVTISNCSNNYGPFQFPEKLIPFFATNLIEGKKVPLYGKGLNVRDWLYVEDHCQAIDLILKKGKIGETYCVGGDSEKSNIEIAKAILKSFGKDESWIEYVEDRKGHDLRYAIDFSKIKKDLDWKPTVDFTTGLEQTLDWYRKNEDWWKKLKK